MEYILETKLLTKYYGRITAVNGLNLAIKKGSVYGLLGPNGSGKTTTLGMVLGVTKPSSGTFSWFGKELDFTAKSRMGALLETPNFYPYLSAKENLRLVATIKEIENPDIEGTLRMVNLWERAGSKFKTFSLGMKQRLAIASALIGKPDVLVLDEPTNGLDPQGIAEVRNLIQKIANDGITVILASHLLVEIEKLCTHVAVLKSGNLIYQGTTDQLTGHEGHIELDADNRELLLEVLSTTYGPASLSQNSEGLTCLQLPPHTNVGDINRELVSSGVYVKHLVFRKNTLEEQFLNLLKNDKAL